MRALGAQFCVVAAVALASGAFMKDVRAELYSWVDARGVIHFADVDPRSAQPTYLPYEDDDLENFGGQAPVVWVDPTSQSAPRVLYPVDVARFDDLFARAGAHYDVPFSYLKAIAKAESNFNPRARSRANAKGLMQLIDETAKMLRVEDPYDPEQAVFGAARYLRILANALEGDLALTAAAYNAGLDRVRRAKGIPAIAETEEYVRRVMTLYRHYLKTEGEWTAAHQPKTRPHDERNRK